MVDGEDIKELESKPVFRGRDFHVGNDCHMAYGNGRNYKKALTVYVAKRMNNGHCFHEVASEEWMENYMKARMAPL